MHMIKLVLSDMDNTLVPFGSYRVPEEVRAAIHATQDAGILFGPDTGRDAQELARFFAMDTRCFETGILSNGKRVRLRGKTLVEKYISVDTLNTIGEMARSNEHFFVNCYPADTNLFNPAYAMGSNPVLLEYYERRFRFNGALVDELPQDITRWIGATVAVFGSEPGTPLAEELEHEIKREIETRCPDIRMVQPVPGWFDILPRGVSKASALDALMAELGLSPDEVVVFGDAENDLEIFGKVPYSVAVANATPEAKRAANFSCGACEDFGVAKALYEIIRAKEAGELPSFLR